METSDKSALHGPSPVPGPAIRPDSPTVNPPVEAPTEAATSDAPGASTVSTTSTATEPGPASDCSFLHACRYIAIVLYLSLCVYFAHYFASRLTSPKGSYKWRPLMASFCSEICDKYCNILHRISQAANQMYETYSNTDWRLACAFLVAVAFVELQMILFAVTEQTRADIRKAVSECCVVRKISGWLASIFQTLDEYEGLFEDAVKYWFDSLKEKVLTKNNNSNNNGSSGQQRPRVIRDIKDETDERSLRVMTRFVRICRPEVAHVIIDGVTYELRRQDAKSNEDKCSTTDKLFPAETKKVARVANRRDSAATVVDPQPFIGTDMVLDKDCDKGAKSANPFICTEDDIPDADEDIDTDTSSTWSETGGPYEDDVAAESTEDEKE